MGSVLPPPTPPIPQEEPEIICRLVKRPVWDRENQDAISGDLGAGLALRLSQRRQEPRQSSSNRLIPAALYFRGRAVT